MQVQIMHVFMVEYKSRIHTVAGPESTAKLQLGGLSHSPTPLYMTLVILQSFYKSSLKIQNC